MSFHEVQFPPDISWGSVMGPGFNTNVIVTDSGHEERTSRWSQARRKYDVAESIKTDAQLAALITFYLGRQGAAYGFRFKDWSDYASTVDHTLKTVAVASTDQNIGVGDGTTVNFQLLKNYISGPVTRVRTITKPVSGTVKVALNGVNQVSGWSVDTTTGIITFSAAPGAAVVVSAGYEFDVPARFGEDVDGQLPMSMDAWDSNSTKVSIIEIRDDITSSDEFFYGGAVEIAITTNLTLTGITRVWVISAAASLSVSLPDPTTGVDPLTPGGPWFFIVNDGSNSFTLKNHLGTTLTTLAAGQMVQVIMSIDALGTKVWYTC